MRKLKSGENWRAESMFSSPSSNSHRSGRYNLPVGRANRSTKVVPDVGRVDNISAAYFLFRLRLCFSQTCTDLNREALRQTCAWKRPSEVIRSFPSRGPGIGLTPLFQTGLEPRQNIGRTSGLLTAFHALQDYRVSTWILQRNIRPGFIIRPKSFLSVKGRYFMSSPNQWGDPTTQRWCYGYDAELAIRKEWEAMS